MWSGWPQMVVPQNRAPDRSGRRVPLKMAALDKLWTRRTADPCVRALPRAGWAQASRSRGLLRARRSSGRGVRRWPRVPDPTSPAVGRFAADEGRGSRFTLGSSVFSTSSWLAPGGALRRVTELAIGFAARAPTPGPGRRAGPERHGGGTPDDFAIEGQDWGSLRSAARLRAAVRPVRRNGGAGHPSRRGMRVDHVMGLVPAVLGSRGATARTALRPVSHPTTFWDPRARERAGGRPRHRREDLEPSRLGSASASPRADPLDSLCSGSSRPAAGLPRAVARSGHHARPSDGAGPLDRD